MIRIADNCLRSGAMERRGVRRFRSVHAVDRRRGRILGLPGRRGHASASRTGRGRPTCRSWATLSSRHARVRRDGEGYLIEALREVAHRRPAGARRRLAARRQPDCSWAESVRLLFRQPHPLSGTARLDFLSRHRTQPSADAVLLMADPCILGPQPHSHVVCRDWTREVVLYRRRGASCIAARRADSRSTASRAMAGPDHQEFPRRRRGFSFNLEAIGERRCE